MLLSHKKQLSFAEIDSSQGPYAAIDLGSNTCRLLIVRKVDRYLEVVETFSRFARLGAGISKNGFLGEEAMERTIQALLKCTAKIRHHSPKLIRAVATEAVRRSHNGFDFVKKVKQVCGISLEIISHYEEAGLALKGCADLLDDIIYNYYLVFDIGGASTEVMWVQRNEEGIPLIIDCLSLPFGVVTLSEDYQTHLASHYRMIRENTYNLLEEFTQRHSISHHISQNNVQILGTSGTATTAVAIMRNLKRYDRSKIDGVVVSYSDIREIIKIIQMMSHDERNFNPCIGLGRGDLVLGGLAVLEGICDIWPVGRMKVADRGVREGLVTQLAFDGDPSFFFRSYEPLKEVA